MTEEKREQEVATEQSQAYAAITADDRLPVEPFIAGLAVIAALAVGGAAVAGYQSWMQAFPYLVTECGYSDPNLIERLVDWLGMQWPAMFMVTGFCTQKDWVFLGLSLANWSVFCFLGLLAGAVWLLLRKKAPR